MLLGSVSKESVWLYGHMILRDESNRYVVYSTANISSLLISM